MKRIFACVIIFLFVSCSGLELQPEVKNMPVKIENWNQAIYVAFVYMRKKFGYTNADIFTYRPYSAALKDGVWTVQGTPAKSGLGYAPFFRIKDDLEILEMKPGL